MDALTSWKTTITAIVGAIAALVAHFGFEAGPEIQSVIVTIAMVIIGLFAKDQDVSGTKDQPR